MVETLFFIGGIILGSSIIYIGIKLGKDTNSNDPFISITPPPQYSDEDRTPTTPYDYDNYNEYLKFNPKDDKEDIN